jgi:CubicO group peptidase (beta-lactamase class C family)
MGGWASPPAFASGAGGLVSTADDFLAFGRMLLAGGRLDETRILREESVTALTADHLTPKQKALSPFFPGFWDDQGWGFGVAVTTRQGESGTSAGTYGWNGGYGTSWLNDPERGVVAVFLIQRLMTGPNSVDVNSAFFRAVWAALEG